MTDRNLHITWKEPNLLLIQKTSLVVCWSNQCKMSKPFLLSLSCYSTCWWSRIFCTICVFSPITKSGLLLSFGPLLSSTIAPSSFSLSVGPLFSCGISTFSLPLSPGCPMFSVSAYFKYSIRYFAIPCIGIVLLFLICCILELSMVTLNYYIFPWHHQLWARSL